MSPHAYDPPALRVCLLVVRLASRIVPAQDREPWRLEWEAELRHRWSRGGRMSRAGEMHMVRRTFGSLVDAAWLRRQLTGDADILHDAAHGMRMLAKSPGFTAVVLLVLATGIGASTAIVSLTDALLFKRLPIPEADRVITLWERNRATGVGRDDVAPGNAIDWITRTPSFSAAAVAEPWSLDLTAPGGEPEVLYADGKPASVPGDDALIHTTIVAGDYFKAMNIPLERGRLLDPTDRADTRKVVVVSRSAAKKFWPGIDPVGARVKIRFNGKPIEAEVVGLVGDARHDALDRPARPEMFLAHPQVPFGSMTFVVRTQAGSPTTMQMLKQQVWTIDPQQAFYRTATLDELVSRTLVGRRFSVFLLTGFGVAALLLAAAGLYGVMSFSTSQRSREFGLRVALGARPADIVTMVVGEGLRLALAGILAGVMAAVWLTRLLSGLLFGISATDPLTFCAVSAAILAVSALSCYAPARRAVRVDPLITLKTS